MTDHQDDMVSAAYAQGRRDQRKADMALMQQALALIASARLCEVNSMSSRTEMLRLLIEATDILRAALAQEQAEPTGKQPLQVNHGLNMNTPQAAQRLLDAIDAAMPHAPHRAEFDIVADAADDLRAALKREEEALAWLEERKQHWRRELDRMRSPQ